MRIGRGRGGELDKGKGLCRERGEWSINNNASFALAVMLTACAE